MDLASLRYHIMETACDVQGVDMIDPDLPPEVATQQRLPICFSENAGVLCRRSKPKAAAPRGDTDASSSTVSTAPTVVASVAIQRRAGLESYFVPTATSEDLETSHPDMVDVVIVTEYPVATEGRNLIYDAVALPEPQLSVALWPLRCVDPMVPGLRIWVGGRGNVDPWEDHLGKWLEMALERLRPSTLVFFGEAHFGTPRQVIQDNWPEKCRLKMDEAILLSDPWPKMTEGRKNRYGDVVAGDPHPTDRVAHRREYFKASWNSDVLRIPTVTAVTAEGNYVTVRPDADPKKLLQQEQQEQEKDEQREQLAPVYVEKFKGPMDKFFRAPGST